MNIIFSLAQIIFFPFKIQLFGSHLIQTSPGLQLQVFRKHS